MRSRRHAVLVLLFAALLGALSALGIADLRYPHSGTLPPEIHTDARLPSVLPYVGTRVQMTGMLYQNETGAIYLKSPDHNGFGGGSLPWFADAAGDILVTNIPSAVRVNVQLATVAGTISTKPVGFGARPRYEAALAVDTLHCDSYNSPTRFRPREWLDSASIGMLIILVLLLPLWLRACIQLLHHQLSRTDVHVCPCCGYDCRGTPLRCPECGSRLDAPNTRLDLNPK